MDFWSRDTWLYINTFADWFSGVGTIAAVWVALYMAWRDRRIHVIPRAAYQVQLISNLRSRRDIIGITITNAERRTATLTSIYWKTGVCRREIFVQTPIGLLEGSSIFPQELRDGEQAHYRYLTDDFRHSLADFKQSYPRLSSAFYRAIWLRRMKIGVETSNDKTFEKPIHGTLRRWFSKELKGSLSEEL